MDKDSTYWLQRVDCNCNNCYFMQRDMAKFEESLARHKEWQLDYFNKLKSKMVEKAAGYEANGELDKANQLLREANKMKFQFNRAECRINYGHCDKFDKPVTFIPNTCQIDTQHCFVHRSDIK